MVTEEDLNRVVRGPADLEERIEQLMKQKELLKTACKKAGARIAQLEEDIDRLVEENSNLRTMIKK